MNTLLISVAALLWFMLGYIFYGRFIEKTLVQPDDSATTPAHTMTDGVDYAPSKRTFLWGNHFASIAGAGPIIGPILAVSIFGWGPTLLWVLLGALFMGAVHDYLSLMISVRHQGVGIAQLAESILGRTVRLVFAVLLFIVLVLLIAVFMVSVAQALIHVPALVIPTLGLVAIAVVLGLAVERWGIHAGVASVAAVLLAYFLIWVGYKVPIALPASWGHQAAVATWCVVLAVYCLWASVSPIWLLLRPRDFISSVKLVVGIVLGFAAIAVIHPGIDAPFLADGFMAHGKPLWPMLFIMVACGAISGFHSLVSTGTTSRQLNRQKDGRPIAFGGMLMEGVLAMMVIMLVAGGLKWGMAPAGVSGQAANLYFGTALSKSWIVAFGSAFGNLVGSLGIPILTIPLAALVGSVMVKSFILTTLDAGTRLARFLVTESLGEQVPVFNNRWLASLVVLVPALLIAVTDSYHDVWRLFGAANQLIAALALITITAYLAQAKLPKAYTLWPAVFMLATTIAALLWESLGGAAGYLTADQPDWSLGITSMVLVLLAVVIAVRGLTGLARGSGRQPGPMDQASRPVDAKLGGHHLKF